MASSEKTLDSVRLLPWQGAESAVQALSATARRRSTPRTLFGSALAAGVVVWIVIGPVTKVPLWGDEGQHLNGAKQVLLSSQRWFRPVFDPRASQGWTDAEIANCHFPPAMLSVYAASLALFGPGSAAFGTPLLLAHAMAAMGLFVLCRRFYGTPTAWTAVLLWVFSPAGFRRGSQIMAEPFLVCFGLVALALLAEAMHQRSRRLACAAGACLGMAFLTKLWLAGPFVMMALAMIAAGERGERLRLVTPLLVVGVMTGGLHLAVVAVAAPDLLGTWAAIYFELIFSRIRPVDQLLVSTGPIWHYLPLLYRDHWPLLLPLTAFVWDWFRRGPTDNDRATRNLFLAAMTALGVLSIYESKTPLYVYYLAPLAALAAARGVTCLAEMAPIELRSVRPWLWAAFGFFAAATGAAWVGWALGKFSAVLTLAFCIAHALASVWFLILLRTAPRWRCSGRTTGLLVVPVGVGIVTSIALVQAHVTDPAGSVADYFAARGLVSGQDDVRFVSPRWHALGFHLWEQGRPWSVAEGESVRRDILGRLASGQIEFVEIDREFCDRAGALPDAETHEQVLAWLREQAVDVTPAIEYAAGRRLSTYVFVPIDSPAAANAVGEAADSTRGHAAGLPRPP